MSRQTRNDLLVCLSLANLSLIEIWRRIIFAQPFLLPRWSWRDLVAAAIVLLLLTCLFYLVDRLGRSTPLRRLGVHRWIFLVPLVVFSNFVRHQFPGWTNRVLTEPNLKLYAALLVCCAVLLLMRYQRWLFRAAEFAALCLLPFLALAFLEASWVVTHEPPYRQLAGRINPSKPAAHRFVWIVYDEADWRYMDPASRPANLHLPELDRLMSESVWAQNAIQSGIQTASAIPSLMYGEPIMISLSGPRGRITSIDHHPSNLEWSSQPNIFAWTRAQGLNGTIVGWYIPYCRIFPDVLSDCYWEAMDSRVRAFEPSLDTSLRSVVRSLWPMEERQRHLLRYRRLVKESIEDATDPTLSLVLLHLPVPHEPAIYDRKSGQLTMFNFHSDWYLDNLALADRTLGEIRRAMEQAGVWESSTVLVTSDHALRWYAGWNEQGSPLIPYIVKLPFQKRGIPYHNRFHTINTHDLIQASLEGQIRSPEALLDWLDRRSLPSGTLSAKSAGAGQGPGPSR